MNSKDKSGKIIFFDGQCNLCSWSVRFVIRNDKQGRFSFSSLQSNYAKKYDIHPNGKDIKFNTLVYIDNYNIYTKSDGAIQILKDLGGVWNLFTILKVIPRKWRDAGYDLVAKHRYRWFGKRDHCLLPANGIHSRFLG